jgi:outer membrane protein assembly factor BamB
VPDDTINPAPVLGANNLIYVSSWNHYLYALDSRTGGVVWKFVTGKQINASPAVGPDGTVYVGSDDHYVYALNGNTGALRWRFLTAGALETSPVVTKSNVVYVGGNDTWIYALSGRSGAVVWRFKTGSQVATPVVGSDGTVYAGADRIYAFDGKTGAIRWTHALDNDAATPVAAGPNAVYVADHEGNVTGLDSATGQPLWRQSLTGDALYMPCVSNREIVVATDKLYALRPNSGDVCWSYTGGGNQWSTPVMSGNRSIVAGSDDQGVYSVDAVTGDRQWRFDTGDPMISFPAVGPHGTVYVSCEGNGMVYALDGRTGLPKWQFAEDPVPPDTPAAGVATRTAAR